MSGETPPPHGEDDSETAAAEVVSAVTGNDIAPRLEVEGPRSVTAAKGTTLPFATGIPRSAPPQWYRELVSDTMRRLSQT